MHEEQRDLGRQSKALGITSVEWSILLNAPAGSIRCWLTGAARMPDHHMQTMRRMLRERQQSSVTTDSTVEATNA